MGVRKTKAVAGRRIGFIGGGNMAEALVRGLLAAGRSAAPLAVAEPQAARRRLLARKYGVVVSPSNAEVCARSEQIVLAVKPQIMNEVLGDIAAHVGRSSVVISIAAGVTLARLEKGLGGKARVVRVMPNTPCLLGKGASVLCGGKHATRADLRAAMSIFETVGLVERVDDEKAIDAVTGLSGSGPAYVYRFAEALIDGAVRAGLDRELAARLAYQTIAGAAAMLIETGQSPADLRKAVSSPGGTTLAGLARLDEGGFARTVAAGVLAATKRSRELGRA
jgi:pyrroline-5-carboxylate reductase